MAQAEGRVRPRGLLKKQQEDERCEHVAEHKRLQSSVTGQTVEGLVVGLYFKVLESQWRVSSRGVMTGLKEKPLGKMYWEAWRPV